MTEKNKSEQLNRLLLAQLQLLLLESWLRLKKKQRHELARWVVILARLGVIYYLLLLVDLAKWLLGIDLGLHSGLLRAAGSISNWFGGVIIVSCIFIYLRSLAPCVDVNLFEVCVIWLTEQHIETIQKNLLRSTCVAYRLLPKDWRADLEERLHRLKKANKPLWLIRLKRIQYLLELFWGFVQIKWANIWLPHKNKIEK
jgi:hypothetical protein